MAKADQVRCTRIIHTIVAILILLSGAALLSFGIWLSVTGNKGPFNLDYTGDNIWKKLLIVPNIIMAMGAFLILTCIVSLISLSRNCVGVTARIIYIVLAIIIFIVLGVIFIGSIVLLRNRDNQSVENYVKDAWEGTVLNEPQIICDIEKEFQCKGFLNNDCDCQTGLEQQCDLVRSRCVTTCSNPPSTYYDQGCYNKMVAKLVGVFFPVAIASGILIVLVFVDMICTCCL